VLNSQRDRLWILAGKLELPRLQNDTLDRLEHLSSSERVVATSQIPYVYRNTPLGSALRKYFVDSCARNLNGRGFAVAGDFPKQMLLDLSVVFSGYLEGKELPARDMTAFYVEGPR
jgi:hypothetical protein